MKCNCCDSDLSDKEIIWNEEIGTWELCSVCLEVAMDAAYSQGFTKEDDVETVETDWDQYGDDLLTSAGVRWPY